MNAKRIENLIFLSLVILIKIKFILSRNSIKANYYSKVKEFNNLDLHNSYLLGSFDKISKLNCLSSCSKIPECFYTVYSAEKCLICKKNLTFFMKTGGDSLIYKKKFKSSNGLINYWAFNGNVNDSIGDAHLFGGVNASLAVDRFEIQSSAISLKGGYYKVPDGVYFSGIQLSIMAWVKIRTSQLNARLIDFALPGSPPTEEVLVSFNDSTYRKPYAKFQSKNNSDKVFSQQTLILNKWQNLACVFSFPYYSIYIDGVEATTPGSKTNSGSLSLLNIVRTSNFIGKSNWANDQNADADIDDLKFFNRALSLEEILFEMNNNL